MSTLKEAFAEYMKADSLASKAEEEALKLRDTANIALRVACEAGKFEGIS